MLYIHVCVCVTSHCTNTPWNIAHEYNVIKLHPLYVYDVRAIASTVYTHNMRICMFHRTVHCQCDHIWKYHSRIVLEDTHFETQLQGKLAVVHRCTGICMQEFTYLYICSESLELNEIIILPSIHYYSVYFNYSIIISGPHCDERKGVRNCMTLCFTLSYSFTPSYYSQFLPFLNCTRVCGWVGVCVCVDVGVCVCVCVYSCTARYSVVYSLMPLLFNSESLELFLLLVPLSKLKDDNDDSNNNT